MSPANPQQLFALSSDANGVLTTYRTDDSGASWVKVGSSAPHLPAVAHLVISPTHPLELFAGDVSSIHSKDGGKTWVKSANPGVHVDLRDAAFLGGKLYLATDGGVFETADLGATAVARNAGLDTTQFYALASDTKAGERIFATSQDNGIWRRPETGGKSWTSIGGGDGFLACLVDPSLAHTFYFSSVPGSWSHDLHKLLHRTEASEAASIQSVGIDPPTDVSDNIGPLIGVSHSAARGPFTLYYGDRWIWKSVDRGSHWAKLPAPTGEDAQKLGTKEYLVTAIAGADVGRSDALLIAKGALGVENAAVFFSHDGGATWTKGTGAPSTFVYQVALDPRDDRVAYLATADAKGPPVYCSKDGGKTWAACSNGLPVGRYGRAVKVDALDSSIVYAGTDVGLFRSLDRGATWHAYGRGAPICPITDIEALPSGRTLRLATYGCGIAELTIR